MTDKTETETIVGNYAMEQTEGICNRCKEEWDEGATKVHHNHSGEDEDGNDIIICCDCYCEKHETHCPDGWRYGWKDEEEEVETESITFVCVHKFEWTYDNFCVAVEDVLGVEYGEEGFPTEEMLRKMWKSCLKRCDGKVDIELSEDDMADDWARHTTYPVMDEMAKEELKEVAKIEVEEKSRGIQLCEQLARELAMLEDL